MTLIRLELRRDATGGPVPISGRLTANRTRIRRDGSVITYPGILEFVLAGATTVYLDPPALDEALILRLYPDREKPEVRTVRFSGTTVDWADLVDVDPVTLDPTVEPPAAAWAAALAELHDRITPTVALSQAAYNAIAVPDPGTLYLITS